MFKKKTYLWGSLILVYLLGYLTRGVLSYERVKNKPAYEQELKVSSPKVETKNAANEIFKEELIAENEPLVIEDFSTYVDVPYDAADPIKRLQALEKLRYNLPGSAFTRLVKNAFNDNENISASLSAIMELSMDEVDQFNEILDETLRIIGEYEANLYTEKIDTNGDVFLTIPPFAKNGLQIRNDLLAKISENLGKDRSNLFEMILLQKPSSFGNFGAQSIVLRNPRFEMVNGRHEIVTVDIGKIVEIGTEDERFEGIQKAYKLETFKKRYGKLFKLP